jgi:formylglycine-generating enzyme required for sulfatase activity/tRNA A-37 threonylcarbamoyl transferase component Bud32
MNPERWRRIEDLFSRASGLPPDRWPSFLASEAADDSELADEVLRMLRAQTESKFIEPPTIAGDAGSASRGDRLQGRTLGEFELLEKIGEGGMGAVYRARQRSLGRNVAVKVLQSSPFLQAHRAERFEKEARAAARLNHPNIVAIHAVGHEEHLCWFAMELVEGADLASEIRRRIDSRTVSDARLPAFDSDQYLGAVVRLAEQAADGLAHAHEHGVVHRDIKPSNLLLDSLGNVRIVDFGLARDEQQGSITRTDEQAGTPHYMSPEQVRRSLHFVDERTDVYSLGVVLYELLTLHRPFDGSTSAEIWHRIVHEEPPRVRSLAPRVPRDLELVCNTAMARDIGDRYSSAIEFRDDLRRFLRHEAVLARAPSLGRRARRLAAKYRGALLWTGAAVVAGATVSFVHRESGLATRRDRVREVLSEPNLDEVPVSRLLEARAAALELSSTFSLRGRNDRELATMLGNRMAELRRAWVQSAQSDIAGARDRTRPEGVREWLRLRGFQTLQTAAFVFSDDVELHDLARAATVLPTLTVRALDARGQAIPATVSLREVDVMTTQIGPKQPLGPAPILRAPVRPSYCRVVVEFAAGGFRELICNPSSAQMDVALTAIRRPDEDAIGRDMVQFEATEYTFPAAEGFYSDLDGKSVHLDAFAMDRYEVSNGEWRRFLAANPERKPPRWWSYGYSDALDDLPVGGVPWDDIQAYCGWSGKRLPTAGEWQYAARGHEGRLYPTGPLAPGATPPGNVACSAEIVADDEAHTWALYQHCAASVRSSPEASTPEGLIHMFGNVSEITESMAISDAGGFVAPRMWDRIEYGCAWNAHLWNRTLATFGWSGIGPQFDEISRGFRCARSLIP